MSENYSPQSGMPYPVGNSAPYGGEIPSPQPEPVYMDPNISNSNSPVTPGVVITGHPGGGQAYRGYPAYAPGRNYGAVSQKEADTRAIIALTLGIISFFFLGFILSVPGYFLAKQAEIANGSNAKVAKIVNLVSIVITGSVLLFFVFIVMIAGVNHLQ